MKCGATHAPTKSGFSLLAFVLINTHKSEGATRELGCSGYRSSEAWAGRHRFGVEAIHRVIVSLDGSIAKHERIQAMEDA